MDPSTKDQPVVGSIVPLSSAPATSSPIAEEWDHLQLQRRRDQISKLLQATRSIDWQRPTLAHCLRMADQYLAEAEALIAFVTPSGQESKD